MSFDAFTLSPEIRMGLDDRNFTAPTPIQNEAIPVILEGKDVIASAQTGTGKTAAFAIPILEKLFQVKKPGVRALLLAPTRELAQQIDEQFWTLGYHSGITTVCVYGGGDWSAQQAAIRDGVNVVVATPGRLLDLIKSLNIDFSGLEFLVLDEADRMLDMGFIPDVRTIVARLPKNRQTLLFSATISDRVEALVKELTREPARINVSSFKTADGVTQVAYKIREDRKIDLVLHLFEQHAWTSGLIFTATKRGCAALARALSKKGVKVGSMHGDMEQHEREATLGEFRRGNITTIVATDVMARGIDINNISHVLNFNVPRDLDDYIHRIGRTARAESTGTAITLVSPEDERPFKTIIQHVGKNLSILDSPLAAAEEGAEVAPAAEGDRPRRSEGGRGRGRDRGRDRDRGDRPRRPEGEAKPKAEAKPEAKPEAKADAKPERKDRREGDRDRNRDRNRGGRDRDRKSQSQEERIRNVKAQVSLPPAPAPVKPKSGIVGRILSLFGKK